MYTIGEIGAHKVVATKLSAFGNTLQATTAAGSVTTRLLGLYTFVKYNYVI